MEHLVDVAAPAGEGDGAPQQQEQTAEQAAQAAYEQQVRGFARGTQRYELATVAFQASSFTSVIPCRGCICFSCGLRLVRVPVLDGGSLPRT